MSDGGTMFVASRVKDLYSARASHNITYTTVVQKDQDLLTTMARLSYLKGFLGRTSLQRMRLQFYLIWFKLDMDIRKSFRVCRMSVQSGGKTTSSSFIKVSCNDVNI